MPIFLSRLEQSLYDRCIRIVQMFETSELKAAGKPAAGKKRKHHGKSPNAKECPLYLFRDLRLLEDQQTENLLDQVIGMTMTLNEMAKEAKLIKACKEIQTALGNAFPQERSWRQLRER